MKVWIRRRVLRLAVITTGLLALGAGIAYATIPDGNGVFTACKLNNVGTVRLIDPSLPAGNLMSHCTPLETQVSWNQGGPLGPQGPPGDKGPTGEKGPVGDKGSVGNKGLVGDQGPIGPIGGQGPIGEKGPLGDKGLVGDQGLIGPIGSQGAIGEKGPLGDKGPVGDKGQTGDPGPQGPTGPAGGLRCPAGTIQRSDFCTETSLRSAYDFSQALNTCHEAHRHLPTYQQLYDVVAFPEGPLGAQTVQESLWTADFVSDTEVKTPVTNRNVFFLTGSVHSVISGDQLRFFCVVNPG